jgi:hypothetical protein
VKKLANGMMHGIAGITPHFESGMRLREIQTIRAEAVYQLVMCLRDEANAEFESYDVTLNAPLPIVSNTNFKCRMPSVWEPKKLETRRLNSNGNRHEYDLR